MKMSVCLFGFLFLISSCTSLNVNERRSRLPYTEAHLNTGLSDSSSPCCEAKGKEIAIAAGGQLAANAGLEIYRKGGNIVDVAVATAFVLSVERPSAASLGGGGFMTAVLQSEPSKSYFLDFRETAPHQAFEKMFQNERGEVISGKSSKGALSMGTPGMVAGYWEMHSKWGKLTWKEVLQPAIQLAEEGFPAHAALIYAIEKEKEVLLKDPYTRSLLFRRGRPLKRGELFRQVDLAKTLRLIASLGPEGFYKSPISKKIATYVQKKGGILSEKDFEHYSVRFREPILGDFKQYSYVTSPPPSAGGILLAQAFKLIEEDSLLQMTEPFDQYLNFISEVLNRGFADRFRYSGDPDFTPIDTQNLLSAEYVQRMREGINLERHTPAKNLAPTPSEVDESPTTTHLSVMDNKGNAISMTLTINGYFGAGFAVPGTGVFMNDEMDDFATKPGEKNMAGIVSGKSNAVEPLKRPASSMAPTIILKGSQPVLAVGGAGGPTIISGVVQVTFNYLELYGDLKRAVYAPRIHSQWYPEKLFLIKDGFEDSLQLSLKNKGHEIEIKPLMSLIYAVGRDAEGNVVGVSDPRKTGGSAAE